MRHFLSWGFFATILPVIIVSPSLADTYQLRIMPDGSPYPRQLYCYYANNDTLAAEKLRLIKCDCSYGTCEGIKAMLADKDNTGPQVCQQEYSSLDKIPDEPCLFSTTDSDIWKQKGVNYYCVPPSQAHQPCGFCGADTTATGVLVSDKPWSILNASNNSVSRSASHVVHLNSGSSSQIYECLADAKSTTQYGCAENYYQSGGTTANPLCSLCPTLAGTTTASTNAIGETDITSCCIQTKSLNFTSSKSDGVFGSGTVNGKCCASK